VLASLVADVAPAPWRGTAFGVFNLATGAGLLLSSALAGALWDHAGPPAAFWFGAGCAACAALAVLPLPLLLRAPRAA
jgi:MFS family permease